MNLSTIELPKDEAERHWREYADAVRATRSDEDAALAEGYKALSEGRALISLQRAITEGGCLPNNLPRLAVGPVRSEWCYVERRQNGSVTFRPTDRGWARSTRLPPDTLPRCEYSDLPGSSWERGSWRAMVPIVPPEHRPKGAPRMTRYHVLWEVDEWQVAPRPPGDPALLKHLRGDLWMLLATWDLTDLERAVLSQRATDPP